MKNLINDLKHVIREMLEGLTDLACDVALLSNENVVVRAELPRRSERLVGVVSGGG